jgi:PAS domain-containing protein
MVETLGYTEEELLMHPFLDFVHADDKENTQKEIETIREGSQTLEFKNRWICKDDSIKWLVWSAIAEPATGLMRRRPRYYRTCKIRKRKRKRLMHSIKTRKN